MTSPVIAVLDYGIGNLRSAQRRCKKLAPMRDSPAIRHSSAMHMPPCCPVSATSVPA